MDSKAIIKHRFDKAKEVRRAYEDIWKDISHYVSPNRGNFTGVSGSTYNRTTPNIYTTTALHSNILLASTIYSGLINPATKWFAFEIEDQKIKVNDRIKLFLEKSVDVILKSLNNPSSGFYQQAYEIFLDLTAYGTSVLYMEEDDELGFRFSSRHLNEIYIAEDYQGIVDTVFREFRMTARQVVQQFGDKALQVLKISQLMEARPDEEVCIIHAVTPNEGVNKESYKKQFKFKSCYYIDDFKEILDEGYYYDMPYAVPRWTKRVGDIYGRSPAANTLADIKTVNVMEETLIIAAQKQAVPTLLLADDGVLSPVKHFAGSLIYGGIDAVTGQKRVQTLDITGNLSIGEENIAKRDRAIRSGFFVNHLSQQDNPRMSATEIIQRRDEDFSVMSPQISRIENEFLNVVLQKIFTSFIRRGFITDIPQELKDVDIKISYKSPLQKLQQMESVNALAKTIQAVIPFIQADPSLMQVFKADDTIRHVAETMGVPFELLNSQEEMMAIRQQQQQAQAMQQQMEMLKTGSEAGKNMGSMMSDLQPQ